MLNSGSLSLGGDLKLIGLGAEHLTVDANGQSGVFSGVDIDAIIDGLTITGGDSPYGGGIFMSGYASLTLMNTTVSDNSANEHGGGIFLYGWGQTPSYEWANTTLTLINTTISGNSAGGFGGGIFNFGGLSTTLTNSTISDNSAEHGGGISNSNGILTLTNTTVLGNSANDSGGGINNSSGILTLTNTTVSGNLANDSGGGGIYNSDTLTLPCAHMEGWATMSKKRVLSWAPNWSKKKNGGRWRKQIDGKVHYFGDGKSEKDLKSYRAAEQKYFQFMTEREATKPIDIPLAEGC